MVPSAALPPAVPFTYHVIVVVVVVFVEFERVTAAVNVVVVLIGTLTDAGVIATAVTRTLPLPPPHDEMITNPPIASAKTNLFENHFLITGLPLGRSSTHPTSTVPRGLVLERSRESHT
jgi:hypothetical protein